MTYNKLAAALLVLVLPATTLLSGCAPLLIGGAAATTALVVTDRRTTGEQVEDKAIVLKVGNDLRTRFPDENTRFSVTSYAGLVLLTGDVPTEAVRQQSQEIAAGVEHVKRVVNRLRVGETTPLSVRSNDTWLGSRVRTALINGKDVPSLTIVTTTERGIVYLLGKVTAEEGERAAVVASHVNGVNQVVKLFDVVSPASLAAGQAGDSTPSTTSTSQQPVTAPADSGAGDVQAMPVQ